MGLFSSTLDRIATRLGYIKAAPEEVVQWGVREGIYAVNQMLYDGTAYQTRANAGALEDILKTYIGPAFCDVNKNKIQPFLLPFKEIVEAYQYVLPGTWGDGVEIADEVNGKPVDQRILEPLAKVWQASLMDTLKGSIIRWAANFGTVGMRVTARGAIDGKPARVAIAADHPARLFNFEQDSEGNVTAVCLKYRTQVNDGTLAEPQWRSVEVVELITKDEFSIRYDEAEQLEDDQRVNNLGFCPYVILRHRENGTPFGDWAYRGTEGVVHRLNWRVSRQDKSIDRHQFPIWLFAAGGDKPEEIDMGDSKGHYVQTQAGTPPPVVEAIVPKVDQASAQDFWMEIRDGLRSRQPELNLNDVKLLANTSGEALDRILKPTEKVIGDARPGYQHAFKRVLQMGLSAGVQVGAWDLGTNGDADAAYRQGIEDFDFKPQPLLPPTVDQMLREAQAAVADAKSKTELAKAKKTLGYGRRELWRVDGKTDEEIVELERELAMQNTTLATDDEEQQPEAFV